MLRAIFLLLFLFKLDIVVAQKNSRLQGKWKIISVSQIISPSRDSLYYDLEKDSIYIPLEDLKEAYKDGHDSIVTADLFKDMFKTFKGSSITFQKDSVVFETATSSATRWT
jgi:hypothetical protein